MHSSTPERQSLSRYIIDAEHLKHCDVIQEDFLDSYNNVTLDSIFALKFFHGLRVKPEYLVIGDDDVYLNIPTLWNMLFGRESKKKSEVTSRVKSG